MKARFRRIAPALVAGFILAGPIHRSAFAQTSWIDGVSNWFLPFNWSNGVPDASSPTSFDAQINNGGIAQIFAPGASVRRITLGNLSGHGGGLLVDAGTLNVTENLRLGESGGMGNMTIRANADVTAGVTILGVFSGSGLMTVSGNGSTLSQHTLILGELANGTMIIREGADVSGFHISLANSSSSSFGTMTVTGAGSTLTADDTLWIGRTGAGELFVDTGGAVTAPTIDLGSNNLGSGFAAITGAGSVLTSTNTLIVGNNGFGTINVTAGGRVNSIAIGLGFQSGGAGTVTVTGAGSRLVDSFNSISVGIAGSGVLNLADSGVVNVGSGFGNVIVGDGASGFASTLRIGQGAAPGTLEAGAVSLFRANSRLEFNHTGVVAFSPFISGPGSLTQIANGTTTLTANNTFTGPVTVRAGVLELSAGGRINNATDSNITDAAGQNASVRINGPNAKWINTASTFIGSVGTGSVTVENGGELRSDVQLLVNRFASGNGTLSVIGAGSKAMTNGELRVADEGIGLLNIQSGGVVTSGRGILGNNSNAANGSAIVSGTGSLWSINGDLFVSNRGVSNLRIENGGRVTTTGGDFMGYDVNSSATGVITGAGSVWDTFFLQVGGAGMANLTVSNGASLITRLTGGNSVSVGEQASGMGTVFVLGAGTSWSNAGNVVIGNLGSGTVTVAEGATLTAGGGSGVVRIALQAGSTGTLSIGGGTGPGTLSAGSVVFGPGNGQLIFNHDTTLAFGAIPISGPGRVRKSGFGTTTLSANSSYTGGTTVEGGNLTVTNAAGLGLGSGAVSVNASPTSRLTFAGSGSAGTLSITNRRGISGIVSASTFFQDNATAFSANITNEASSAANEIGGALFFTGTARAGTATITNHGAAVADSIVGSAITEFVQNSSAESATIRNRGSAQQFGQGGFMNFRDSATAGASQITNERGAGIGSFGFGGETNFFGNSRAGTATIINQGGDANGSEGLLDIGDTASADHATITNQGAVNANNGGLTRLFGSATAGQSMLTLESATGAPGSGGRVWFFDTSTAGSATLRAKGGTVAGGIGQSGALGGAIQFFGSASAGSAMILNERATATNALGGTTTFFNHSTAGFATITTAGSAMSDVQGGVTNNAVTEFRDSSTAGSATLHTEAPTASGSFGGVVRFTGSANAGTATLNNLAATIPGGNAGTLNFEGNSSAASATINNRGSVAGLGFGGHTFFSSAATAGSSTILNEGGTSTNFASGATFFFGSSSAGSAAITATGGTAPNAFGGAMNLFDTSTGSNATLTALGGTNGGLGGRIYFEDSASGGNAAVTVQGNGIFTIENLSSAGTTAGSIAGSGSFLLGAKSLTVGSNNTSTTVSGSITGTAGSALAKNGTGTLTLRGVQNYPTLHANGGTTRLESALGTGNSTVSVNAVAQFAADQKLAALHIGPGGEVTLAFGQAPAPVPEPSLIALVLAGFATAIAAGRRERRR